MIGTPHENIPSTPPTDFFDLPPLDTYSLTNVTADAQACQSYTDNENLTKSIENKGAEAVTKAARPCQLGDYEANDLSETQKRDLLHSELSMITPKGQTWSNEPWDYVHIWKKEAQRKGNIYRKKGNEFRDKNFYSCDWIKGKGTVYVDAQGIKPSYLKVLSCGEKYCLKCQDKNRKRLALEKVADWLRVIETQPGFTQSLHFVFTLPEVFEALPLHDKAVQKKLLNEIQDLIRYDIFGRDRRKRSNIGMQFSIHPAGDGDVMRDRWHLHVDVLPGEVVRKNEHGHGFCLLSDTGKKKGKVYYAYEYRWLTPQALTQGKYCLIDDKTADRPGRAFTGHNDNSWFLDLPALRIRWRDIISRVFCPGETYAGPLSNPEVKIIKAKDRSGALNMRLYEKRLKKGVDYNMRSFAREMRNVALRSNAETSEIIIKAERDGLFWWEKHDIGALIDRFDFLKEHNKTRSRGFLQSMAKYDSLFPKPLDLLDDTPKGFVPVPAEIWREFRRERGRDGRFKWDKTQMVVYKCPLTGREIEQNLETFLKWKWS